MKIEPGDLVVFIPPSGPEYVGAFATVLSLDGYLSEAMREPVWLVRPSHPLPCCITGELTPQGNTCERFIQPIRPLREPSAEPRDIRLPDTVPA